MHKYIEISGRKIGYDYAPLVIAEIGINHNGSLKTAKEIVDAAAAAGAEIVKHQTHIPSEEMSSLAKKAIPGNSPYSIWDIMERCALNEEDETELKRYVESKGMIFLSTPFSFAAVDRLERMQVTAYKIGSGEMNNYELVDYIASKNKPIILSTGMNDMAAVQKAVSTIKKHHNMFAILHTTNLYPTPAHLVRLGALEEIKAAFPDEIIGLSDHTTDNLACLAATAIGASVLERHFIDSKERPGEDVVCSMTPQECHDLIEGSALIAQMRGGKKEAAKEEQVTIEFAFNTLLAARALTKGTVLTRADIETKRPFLKGIQVKDIHEIIGRVLVRDIEQGEHFEWTDFQ